METIVSRYPSPTTRNPYQLNVADLKVPLDVISFEGSEYLGKPFHYTIRFTCAERKLDPKCYRDDPVYRDIKPRDLDKAAFLNRYTRFGLYGEPPITYPWEEKRRKHEPLREIFGVITSFKRTGATIEQGHYEITLEPRLARLAQGKQYRLYRRQSVPEIVRHILMERHGFHSHECRFETHREYPMRDHVLQYGETDLAFIDRLLAEVGIWYHFVFDSEIGVEFVRFRDWAMMDCKLELPYRTPAGMSNTGQDSVWDLTTHHRVVEKDLCFRTYDPRQANKYLEGSTEQWRLEHTVYGEHYAYGWSYTEMGEPFDKMTKVGSGHFFARMNNERNRNQRSQVAGTSTSPLLMPGHLLKVTDSPVQDFAEQVLVHTTRVRGKRNTSYLVDFEGAPFDHTLSFRPALLPKPVISGTIPARITSEIEADPYSHIDHEGRYRVKFQFDRDKRERGLESLPLRLARSYAGHRYGLHFPLIAGTEVAIAFEQGDPDRPYISHALHDSEHQDHVDRDNYTRNVLRTPRNNKLRMEDKKGKEHVKLSTDFAGKSQLNLGHLVDKQRKQRGEGFELRSDHWGVLRAGKGLFISADLQTKAQGDVLAMEPACAQLDQAEQQVHDWRKVSAEHHSLQPDVADLQQLKSSATALQDPAILLSAPKGVAAVTPASLLLQSGESTYLQSRGEINLASARRLFAHSENSISLLARQEGMRLVSGKGPLEIESHGDLLKLIAQRDISVQAVEGHVQITAKNGITLGCGGASIRLTAEGEVLIQSPGLIDIRGQHRFRPVAGERFELPVLPTSELPGAVCEDCMKKAREELVGLAGREGRV